MEQEGGVFYLRKGHFKVLHSKVNHTYLSNLGLIDRYTYV